MKYLNGNDVVARPQDSAEEGEEVQPFPGSVLDGTVVEIEAINVDDGAHEISDKARASLEALRHAVETAWVVQADYRGPLQGESTVRLNPVRGYGDKYAR